MIDARRQLDERLSGAPSLRRFAGGAAAIVGGVIFAVLLTALAGHISPRAGGAAFIAILGVLVALVQPRRMFLLGLFLLPVVQVTVARGDLILPLVFVATVAAGRAAVPSIPPSVVVGLILFALFNAVSFTEASDPGRARSFMVVNLALLAGAVWLSGILRDRAYARGAARVYIWSCLISAVIGTLALRAHLPPSDMLLFGQERARALFKDPNDFGGYLVPAFAIVLEEIGRPRLLGWSRKALVAALLVLAFGIVDSFSRDAILSVALASTTVLVVSALRRNGVRGALRSGSVILACGLAGLAFLTVTGSLDYFLQRSRAQTYDVQRFETQSTATREASQKALGHGPGQSEVLLPLPTHSLYVRAFFEEGLLGLLGTLLIVGGTLIAAFGLAVRDADLYGIGSAALLGSWFGLAVASFFVDTVHWRLPYLLAGIVWAAWGHARRRASASSRTRAG